MSKDDHENLPSVSVVCDSFGLNDVDLDYTEADYQNLTTYRLFRQTYQSRIEGANPKSPKPKLMMLLAAKWREFQAVKAPALMNELVDATTAPRFEEVMDIDQENLEKETERQLTPPPRLAKKTPETKKKPTGEGVEEPPPVPGPSTQRYLHILLFK